MPGISDKTRRRGGYFENWGLPELKHLGARLQAWLKRA